MMGLVVASSVKEVIKRHEMQCASDFCEALDKKIEQMVAEAAARAKSNDRKTVRSGDL
jgi:histone H3/H4